MRFRALLLSLVVIAAIPAVIPGRGAGLFPEAVEWGPMGSNVALDASIAITWSAQMDKTSVEAAYTLTDGTTVWGAADFQWVHSGSPPWTSQATALAPLPAASTFIAVVGPTALDSTRIYPLDMDGDGVGGEGTDALLWTFRTENGTPPRVKGTSPSDGETGVNVGSDIRIEFDEPMDAASVEGALQVLPAASVTATWNATRTAVTFVPGLKLRYGTTYSVRIVGSAATDANGAKLDGNGDGTGGDDSVFSFTTEPDVEPPRVLSVTPDRGVVNGSVSADLVIRFSEPMDRPSVEDAFSYSDGAGTWNGTTGEFSWRGVAFEDDTAVFSPFENFPFNAAIAVQLNASRARDLAGFALDGNGDGAAQGSPTDDLTWNFTTEATDGTPPVVVAVDPPNGATEVSETTSVALTFSEAMNETTVEDAFALQDSLRTWTKADGWFAWSRGHDRTSYTPSTTLSFDRVYALSLAATATDVNGIPLAGPFASAFHTRPKPDTTAPTVKDTFPDLGATAAARDVRFSITFDDPMDRARTEASISLARRNGYVSEDVPIGDFAWDAGDTSVSFRALTLLDWETPYRVTVSPGAKNRAGLPLASAYTIGFTTVSWTGRVVGRVLDPGMPVAGATVRLGNATIQTTANGTFTFPTASSGTYDLVVTMTGFEPLRRTVTLSHREAGPDYAQIDLGDLTLQPVAGVSVAAVVSGLAAALAGAIVIGLLLRRLRAPPIETIEEPEDEGEYAELEP